MSSSDFKDSASIGDSKVLRDILFNFLQEDKIMLSYTFQQCVMTSQVILLTRESVFGFVFIGKILKWFLNFLTFQNRTFLKLHFTKDLSFQTPFNWVLFGRRPKTLLAIFLLFLLMTKMPSSKAKRAINFLLPSLYLSLSLPAALHLPSPFEFKQVI